jgi:hypothetical protein
MKFRSLVFFWLAVAGIIAFSSQTYSQDKNTGPLVVDIPEPVPITANSSRPITAFRKATSLFVNNKWVVTPDRYNTRAIFVPEDVVVSAWLSDKKFAEYMKSQGVTTVSIDALRQKGIDVTTFDWSPIGNNYSSVRPMVVGEVEIDPNSIIAMTANKMFDLSTTYAMNMGPSRYAVAVDKKYAENLSDAYSEYNTIADFRLSDPKVRWETPRLYSSMSVLSFRLRQNQD